MSYFNYLDEYDLNTQFYCDIIYEFITFEPAKATKAQIQRAHIFIGIKSVSYLFYDIVRDDWLHDHGEDSIPKYFSSYPAFIVAVRDTQTLVNDWLMTQSGAA